MKNEVYKITTAVPHLSLNRLTKKINDEAAKYGIESETQEKVSPETIKRYMKLILKLRGNFPSKGEHVLATSFGNVIRAFEAYSFEVYGADSIALWPRIIAVTPNSYRQILDDLKSKIDFAVNLHFLSLVLLVEYGCFSLATKSTPWLLIFLALLIVTWITYRLSISFAKEWGIYVKSVFDLYRYDLLQQMGLQIPATWEGERKMWQKLCKLFSSLHDLFSATQALTLSAAIIYE